MKSDRNLAAGLSALTKEWLKVKSPSRNLNRLSAKTEIGPKRLKSLIERPLDPTINEAVSILKVLYPREPHEQKSFLLKHCKDLPWQDDDTANASFSESFNSLDFEGQQKLLRQKLDSLVQSLTNLLEQYERHMGYLVEEMVEKLLLIEPINDQFAARSLNLEKPYKSMGERSARAALRIERRKRILAETQIAELRAILASYRQN